VNKEQILAIKLLEAIQAHPGIGASEAMARAHEGEDPDQDKVTASMVALAALATTGRIQWVNGKLYAGIVAGMIQCSLPTESAPN
jgi:hypothetical protein